ncbi:MAG: hypothetical protein KGI27_09895 [Thaumarchaeota archaeon]|nr:hypothetical protein [Nitrososphaerota archaeon]
MPYTYTPPATPDTQQVQTQQVQQQETPDQKYERLYGQTNQEIKQIREALTSANPSEELKALRAELASLKETVKPPAPVQQAPVRPKWVEKIATGEYVDAEGELANSIKSRLDGDYKKALDEVRAAAYQDALNATHVNLEIDRHVQALRISNPELVPFEKYLQAPVAQRVEEAKAAGKIKAPTDFIREYTAAIDAEVDNLRQLGLVLRGQGKQEAQMRNQQVLASTVITPNPIQSIQPQGQSQQVSEQSIDDYFSQRRSDEARRKGMA